jgi:hypothetical protein
VGGSKVREPKSFEFFIHGGRRGNDLDSETCAREFDCRREENQVPCGTCGVRRCLIGLQLFPAQLQAAHRKKFLLFHAVWLQLLFPNTDVFWVMLLKVIRGFWASAEQFK